MESANNRPIEKLVKNILKTRFEDINPVVIEQAKLRIIDTIGCLIGGGADPGGPHRQLGAHAVFTIQHAVCLLHLGAPARGWFDGLRVGHVPV